MSRYYCTCNLCRPTFDAARSKEDGVAMVEMAVCVPFFVLLLFGLLEIGFLLYQYPIASQAVYDAAHQASKALPTAATMSQDFRSEVLEAACESLENVTFSRRGYAVAVEELQLSDAFSLRVRAIPINVVTQATGDYDSYSLFSTETVIRLRSTPNASGANSTIVDCSTLQIE